MHIKDVLIYVEDQLATFCSASPPALAVLTAFLSSVAVLVAALLASPMPFLDLRTLLISNKLFTIEYNQSSKVKVVKILDLLKFFASTEDKILYEDWHLQMTSKMSINKLTMPTEAFKQDYILSRVADKAFAQLKLRLHADATRPFTTVDKMFEVLTATFGNANEKQKNRAKYKSLRQGNQDFNAFWAEFQKLSQELDYLNETLINDLIKKCNYSIKNQLANKDSHPTNLLELAKRCQRIEQQLKSADCTKLLQDRNVEQDAARKNGLKPNKAIISVFGSSASLAQANPLILSRIV